MGWRQKSSDWKNRSFFLSPVAVLSWAVRVSKDSAPCGHLRTLVPSIVLLGQYEDFFLFLDGSWLVGPSACLRVRILSGLPHFCSHSVGETLEGSLETATLHWKGVWKQPPFAGRESRNSSQPYSSSIAPFLPVLKSQKFWEIESFFWSLAHTCLGAKPDLKWHEEFIEVPIQTSYSPLLTHLE